jgi:maltose alpha-D-glucosyltransferase/alpha-amylase
MLGGDQAKLKLAFSLMFALPGTPVLWYGDEIGMGDDLSLPERNAVRTPMQWSDEANAGFSSAPPDRLVRPIASEEGFDAEAVNVAAQRDVDGTLLMHVERLVRVRRACPEVGWGACRVLETPETGVLALRFDWEREAVVVLHNLSDRAVELRLEGCDDLGHLRPLYCNRDDRARRPVSEPLALDPFGYRWFRGCGERR